MNSSLSFIVIAVLAMAIPVVSGTVSTKIYKSYL